MDRGLDHWNGVLDYWTGVLDRAHAQKTNGSAINGWGQEYYLLCTLGGAH